MWNDNARVDDNTIRTIISHVHGEQTEHARQPDGAQDSTISPSISGTDSLRETTRLQGQAPDPEAWLSRAGSQCLRCWERWLSPVRCRVAAHVRSVRHARDRYLVVLCYHPFMCCHSTLRWYFFVFQQLCFKVHTHTQKNTCVVRECVRK